MKLIKPTTITSAMLVSSTRSENDHAAWSNATTYALGNNVINTTTHRIYESVQAGNLNHDPTTDDGTWWLDTGPTNRWAMLDAVIGTVTSQATPLTVVLTPGIINALALLDVAATTVTVSMKDEPGGATVFSEIYDMGDTAYLYSWYDYFFEDIVPRDTLIVTNLPPYAGCELTVAIAAATTAECGTLAVGKLIDVGSTRYGAGIGIIDYSRKETDQWGATAVIERSYAKKINVDLILENSRVDYIARQLAAVRATPCVWVGDDSGRSDAFASLIAYGFYRDWGITVQYPTHSEATLQIEGLT